MSMRTVSGVGLIIAGMMSGFAAVVLSEEEPRLECESLIDMGAMSIGEEREARVLINNPTGTTIEILRVETTCSCTRARISSGTLAAGDNAELAVVVRAKAGRSTNLVSVSYHASEMSEIRRLEIAFVCEGVADTRDAEDRSPF